MIKFKLKIDQDSAIGKAEAAILRFSGNISSPAKESIWYSDSVHDLNKFIGVINDISSVKQICLLTEHNLSAKFMMNRMGSSLPFDSFQILARENGGFKIASVENAKVISSMPAPTGDGLLQLSLIGFDGITMSF